MSNYKKAVFGVIAAGVIICVIIGVYILANPEKPAVKTSWPTLEEIRDNYSAEQAAADGCVVLDGSTLLAGENIWVGFVNDTEAGRPAAVRIYQAYSDQGGIYYVKELRFDGQKYLLRFYDRNGDTNEEFLSQKEYLHLMRSPYYSNDLTQDIYLLADSPEATSEGYFSAMLSSTFKPENDIYNHCHRIYTNTVDDAAYFSSSQYGTAFADIDGDGREEKCCLGDGPTSGVFSFTLSVYENGSLKYHNVYLTEFYYLSFTQDEEGPLQVQGITQGEPPQTHLFDIVLQEGNIELTEGGKKIKSLPGY